MSNTNQAPEAGKPFREKPHIPDHELIRVIGRGSYGEVWLARNTVGTFRAVKVVYRDQFGDERPFEREYAGLKLFEPLSRNHDGLVDVLHLGRNERSGYFYYVMEAADDALAGQQIEAAQYQPRTLELENRKRGRLPVSECLEIGSSLASALAFLHQSKLVHRDVKPSNIIFVNGVPKLADIGLVAAVGDARSFVGTEGFVPPEGPGTPRADIYSLGKLLYEMSMGKDRQAFPSPPTQLEEFSDRKELVELNEIITKACEPDFRRRHPSAAELRTELELVRRGGSLSRRRRARKLVWAAAVLVLAASLVTGIVLELSKPRLRLIKKLANPEVPSWQDALLGDFDGDGESDLVVANKDRVLAIDMQGMVLRRSREFFGENRQNLAVSLLADLTGDRKDEVFLRWRENLTNLCLGIYNQRFTEFRRFRATGSIFTNTSISVFTNSTGARLTNKLEQIEGASTLEAVAMVHSSENRRILAKVTTGYGGTPRGLYCFDYESQQLLWRHLTAPFVLKVLFTDLAHESGSDIVFGTGSPCNGCRLADGTDDSHSYLYAVSGNGNLLWRRTTGDEYTQCEPLIADLDHSGVKRILVRVAASHELRTEVGRVLQYDFAGNLVASYDAKANLLSFAVADLRGDGNLQVLATDRFGTLHVLNSRLICTQKVELVRPQFHGTNDWVGMFLDAVADLNGDGRPELAFRSSQVRFVSGLNAGQPQADSLVRFQADNRVLVLSSAFQQLATYTVADEWKVDPGFQILLARLAGGRQGLLVLGTEPILLELTSAKLR